MATLNLKRFCRAEGLSCVRFVEARARLSPAVGAEWVSVGSALAMFDGPDSPLTQTFGLGLDGPVSAAQMATIERFFQEHDAPVFHEVSPLADASVLELLNDRGYQPVEFTSILFRPLRPNDEPLPAVNPALEVHRAASGAAEVYTRTSARGWSHLPELLPFFEDLGRVTLEAEGYLPLLVEHQGQPVAAGAMSIAEGVGLLAGASTVPEARRQGAQRALLAYRLQYAVEQGCDLAMMGAAPGSDSQRNAERVGFRIAYTRVKWQLRS